MPDATDPQDTLAAAPAPAPAKRPPKPADDFSREIERTIPRQPLDRVKCSHLFGPYYRCNWWAPNTPGTTRDPAPAWADNVDTRVRKSAFLSVTHAAGKLHIAEVAR